MRNGAAAAGQGRAAIEYRGSPFGKTPERFGQGSSLCVTGVENGIEIRVIQPAAALRRDVESATRRSRTGFRKKGENPVQVGHEISGVGAL
jgi:hypothetical protein